MVRNNVAVAWPNPKNYARFREVSEPGLASSYAEFVATSEPKLAELRKRDANVVKVRVDPDLMADWCREQGLRVDAEGRASYAVFLATQ